MRAAIVLFAIAAPSVAWAQGAPIEERLTAALVAALKPALPYPAADDHNLPVDGSTAPLWLVRWPAPGEARVEIVANPLNPDNQSRANKADEEIQRAVMAAQRKAQAQYERAVAEFEKTGKTDPIDGITLGDEGVAGERFDASIRVIITLDTNQKDYRRRINSSAEPDVSTLPYGTLVRIGANVFREKPAPGQPDLQRYHASEAYLLVGTAAPAITRSGPNAFDLLAVPAAPAAGLVVSLQGNDVLVEQILTKANWAALRIP